MRPVRRSAVVDSALGSSRALDPRPPGARFRGFPRLSGARAPRSRCQATLGYLQVGEAERQRDPLTVLAQPSAARLAAPEHPLDVEERMLRFRSDGRLLLLPASRRAASPSASKRRLSLGRIAARHSTLSGAAGARRRHERSRALPCPIRIDFHPRCEGCESSCVPLGSVSVARLGDRHGSVEAREQ